MWNHLTIRHIAIHKGFIMFHEKIKGWIDLNIPLYWGLVQWSPEKW